MREASGKQAHIPLGEDGPSPFPALSGQTVSFHSDMELSQWPLLHAHGLNHSRALHLLYISWESRYFSIGQPSTWEHGYLQRNLWHSKAIATYYCSFWRGNVTGVQGQFAGFGFMLPFVYLVRLFSGRWRKPGFSFLREPVQSSGGTSGQVKGRGHLWKHLDLEKHWREWAILLSFLFG